MGAGPTGLLLGLAGHGPGDLTLLAVRPDGFIGLRADRDHAEALERYEHLLLGPERIGHNGVAGAPG